MPDLLHQFLIYGLKYASHSCVSVADVLCESDVHLLVEAVICLTLQ